MRSTFRAAPILLAIVCCPAPAGAEPFTAIFDVTIVERFVHATDRFEPFHQEFQLVMTYEPLLDHIATLNMVIGGTVAFSPIPLPSEAAPGPTMHSDWFYVAITPAGFWGPGQPASYTAEAQTLELSPQFTRLVRLSSTGSGDRLARLPPVTPETVPQYLINNAVSPFNFLFDTNITEGDQITGKHAFAYHGTATLEGIEVLDPVPEPGTIALIGGGLALLAARRRRRPNAAGEVDG